MFAGRVNQLFHVITDAFVTWASCLIAYPM
ncbi:hypothetical protein MTYP_03206 [Methylophilaceae bacterium]|nr:hypothetical protein MTYP_03206 [Methylophilaceae bacterium]